MSKIKNKLRIVGVLTKGAISVISNFGSVTN